MSAPLPSQSTPPNNGFYRSSQYCFNSIEVIYLHIRFLAFFDLKAFFLAHSFIGCRHTPGDIVEVKRQLLQGISPFHHVSLKTEFRLSGFVTRAFNQISYLMGPLVFGELI